eukprot:COSAG01_NODE_6034_length_3888_cov_9.383215_3_plen_137_part_00
MITQTLILRLLLQQWQLSELSILRFALCCNCVHLLLYAVAWPGEKWVPFIAIGVAALNFLGSTAITSLVSRHGDEQEQGVRCDCVEVAVISWRLELKQTPCDASSLWEPFTQLLRFAQFLGPSCLEISTSMRDNHH